MGNLKIIYFNFFLKTNLSSIKARAKLTMIGLNAAVFQFSFQRIKNNFCYTDKYVSVERVDSFLIQLNQCIFARQKKSSDLN